MISSVYREKQYLKKINNFPIQSHPSCIKTPRRSGPFRKWRKTLLLSAKKSTYTVSVCDEKCFHICWQILKQPQKCTGVGVVLVVRTIRQFQFFTLKRFFPAVSRCKKVRGRTSGYYGSTKLQITGFAIKTSSRSALPFFRTWKSPSFSVRNYWPEFASPASCSMNINGVSWNVVRGAKCQVFFGHLDLVKVRITLNSKYPEVYLGKNKQV